MTFAEAVKCWLRKMFIKNNNAGRCWEETQGEHCIEKTFYKTPSGSNEIFHLASTCLACNFPIFGNKFATWAVLDVLNFYVWFGENTIRNRIQKTLCWRRKATIVISASWILKLVRKRRNRKLHNICMCCFVNIIQHFSFSLTFIKALCEFILFASMIKQSSK